MAATATEMLANGKGLVAYRYQDGGTGPDNLPPGVGTAKGQFLVIEGACRAYVQTENPKFKTLPTYLLQNVLTTIFRNFGIPGTNEDGVFAPHRYYNAKAPVEADDGRMINTSQLLDSRAAGSVSSKTIRLLEPNEIRTYGYLFIMAHRAFQAADDALGGSTWWVARNAIDRQFTQVMEEVGQAAIPFLVDFGGAPATMTNWFGPAYVGMQAPEMWLNASLGARAVELAGIMADSQAERESRIGDHAGPFMPTYSLDGNGTFSFTGPNEFTVKGETQYRALSELGRTVVRFGGSDQAALLNTINQFVAWLAGDERWHPELATHVNRVANYVDQASAMVGYPSPLTPNAIDGLTRVVNGAAAFEILEISYTPQLINVPFLPRVEFPYRFPLDPPDYFTEAATEIRYAEPHLGALIMRAVFYADQAERPTGSAAGPMPIQKRAVLSKCMGLLSALYVDDEESPMFGTFSPNTGDHVWYSEWHGEIMSSLAFAIQRTEGAVNWPSFAAQCRKWLDGMATWSINALYNGGTSFGGVLWPFAVDWAQKVEEAFTYSTEVWESDSGKEQRMATRILPRRSLSITHQLYDNQMREFDQYVRARQSKVNLIPQWHLAARLTAFAEQGATRVSVDRDLSAHIVPGGLAAIHGRGVFEKVTVLAVYPDEIQIQGGGLVNNWPASSRIYPAYNGIIEGNIAAKCLTGTVAQANATFMMLPQEDRRAIPESEWPKRFTVAGDPREVVTIRPNWVTEPSTDDEWDTGAVIYTDGPIYPGFTTDAGRRTIKAEWLLHGQDEIDAYLALMGRLRGRLTSCWLPSWNDDFVLTADITQDTVIRVKPNEYTRSGIENDLSVAIGLWTYEGKMYLARAESIVDTGTEAIITLENTLYMGPRLRRDIKMVSLVYRVRQASDINTLVWETDDTVTSNVSFVTVIDEVDS